MRAKAVELRLAGYSRRQIAQALGLRNPNKPLSRWLKAIPVPEWTKRPNAKDRLRERCIALRREGLSYADIAERTGASKGSLSLWLRNIPVTDEQRRNLLIRHMEGRLKGAATMKARRLAAETRIMSQAAQQIRQLSDRELLIAGVVAYWAEGEKSKPWAPTRQLSFINSDADMIRLFLRWLDLVGVEKERLSFRISIHEDAHVERAVHYWSEVVDVPFARFQRTTLKKHNPKTVRWNTGREYVGCLTIKVRRGTELYRQIAGWYGGIMESLGRGVTETCSVLGARDPGSNPGAPANMSCVVFERPTPYQCRQAS